MIETTNSSIAYTADGSQTQWEYPYSFFSTDDIKLFITQGGVRTQIAAADYSFDAETKKVTYPLVGDPVASGSTIEITRETPITQEEDSSVQNFKSDDIERIADKLTLIAQDVDTKIADIVAPEGGAIAEAVASIVGASIANHNNSSSSHTSHLVAKTGSSMSGDLTMSNSSKVVLSNTSGNSYNVFSHETSGGVKQLHLTDASSGTGVLLDGNNSNKPFYVNGGNAYRLLDTSDKGTLTDTNLSNLTETGEAHFSKPDLSNVSVSGTSRSAGWAMPSTTHINLTLEASGSSYTAPANGYVYFTISSSVSYASAYIVLEDDNGNETLCMEQHGTGNLNLFMPVSKNIHFKVGYIDCNAFGTGSSDRFGFVYAEGSKTEAE